MARKPKAIIIIAAVLLAVGALLAFNPLEQFRRIQDRQLEADGWEFLEAADYYYKVFFEYPWDALGQKNPNETEVTNSWLQELTAKESINPEFANHSSWNQIYVTQDGTTIYACFDPISERFQNQADEGGKGCDGTFGCLSGCWICHSK